MKNFEIAWLFSELANLLELKGDNPHKIRAYRKGAQVLEQLQQDVVVLADQGRLTTIPSIGDGLKDKVTEYLRTNRIKELDDLRAHIPEGVKDMLSVPGIGPKLARTFWKELQIIDVDELEAAAKAKKLRQLSNVGPRTELNIKRGIQILRSMGDTVPLGMAVPIAEKLVDDLSLHPEVICIEQVGSLRRRQDVVKGIDLLIVTNDSNQVINFIPKLPQYRGEVEKTNKGIRFIETNGIRVDVYLVRPYQYELALFCLTGSESHVKKISDLLYQKAYCIKDYVLYHQGRIIESTETQLYSVLGMDYIPPELREDRGEIQAGMDGYLPHLITKGDILGDLHVHSHYSDGVNSIEQLVAKAIDKGYEYMAICDHSKTLRIANGLSVDRLFEQRAEIKRLNDRLDGFTILSGIEVDILGDGRLDFPDEILGELDIVVASIHSGFKQSRETMTHRIVSAMRNKHVDIIGHPTGRIIGRRPPYEVDMEQLFAIAKETNTILELNSSLDRLDLNDQHVRIAHQLSIPIVINTDAHDTLSLDAMEYGVATARRGWVDKATVVNTWSLQQLKKFLKDR